VTTLAATNRPREAGTPQAGTLPPDATPASEKNRLTPTATESAEHRGLGWGRPASDAGHANHHLEPRRGPAKTCPRPAGPRQAQIGPEPAALPAETPSVDASLRRCAAQRPPSSPRKLRRASLRRRTRARRRSSPLDATAPRGRPSGQEEEIPPPPPQPELCPAAPASGGRGGEEGAGCLDGLGFPPLPLPAGARAGASKRFQLFPQYFFSLPFSRFLESHCCISFFVYSFTLEQDSSSVFSSCPCQSLYLCTLIYCICYMLQ
jgi:hypothetical protein